MCKVLREGATSGWCNIMKPRQALRHPTTSQLLLRPHFFLSAKSESLHSSRLRYRVFNCNLRTHFAEMSSSQNVGIFIQLQRVKRKSFSAVLGKIEFPLWVSLLINALNVHWVIWPVLLYYFDCLLLTE